MRQDEANRARQVWALVAEMRALDAELEGMKVKNADREDEGHARAYEESDFVAVAEQYRAIAAQLKEG